MWIYHFIHHCYCTTEQFSKKKYLNHNKIKERKKKRKKEKEKTHEKIMPQCLTPKSVNTSIAQVSTCAVLQ